MVAREKKVAMGSVSTLVSTPMREKPWAMAWSTATSPVKKPLGPWMVSPKPSG
ncbi:hypothetical protein D3C72_2378370 [compost metagenome]